MNARIAFFLLCVSGCASAKCDQISNANICIDQSYPIHKESVLKRREVSGIKTETDASSVQNLWKDIALKAIPIASDINKKGREGASRFLIARVGASTVQINIYGDEGRDRSSVEDFYKIEMQKIKEIAMQNGKKMNIKEMDEGAKYMKYINDTMILIGRKYAKAKGFSEAYVRDVLSGSMKVFHHGGLGPSVLEDGTIILDVNEFGMLSLNDQKLVLIHEAAHIALLKDFLLSLSMVKNFFETEDNNIVLPFFIEGKNKFDAGDFPYLFSSLLGNWELYMAKALSYSFEIFVDALAILTAIEMGVDIEGYDSLLKKFEGDIPKERLVVVKAIIDLSRNNRDAVIPQLHILNNSKDYGDGIFLSASDPSMNSFRIKLTKSDIQFKDYGKIISSLHDYNYSNTRRVLRAAFPKASGAEIENIVSKFYHDSVSEDGYNSMKKLFFASHKK